MANVSEWLQDLVITPALTNYKVVLTSMLTCFVIQYIGWSWLNRHCQKNKSLSSLTTFEKQQWCLNWVAFYHAIVASIAAPLWFYYTTESFNQSFSATSSSSSSSVAAAGHTRYFVTPSGIDIYAYSPFSQTMLSISTGYFIWDCFVSVYFQCGIGFIAHAYATLTVVFFGLYPFLHHYSIFFFGMFEVSTIFVNLRAMLIPLQGQQRHPVVFLLVEVWLGLLFTIIRIVMGVQVSYRLWIDLLALWHSTVVHSRLVITFYMVSNITLMTLQLYWWSLIVKGALTMVLKPASTTDNNNTTDNGRKINKKSN